MGNRTADVGDKLVALITILVVNIASTELLVLAAGIMLNIYWHLCSNPYGLGISRKYKRLSSFVHTLSD
jgi:hypothetical protein